MDTSNSKPTGPRASTLPPRPRIVAKSLKVFAYLAPGDLPRDLVPADGPAPDVYLDVCLEGSPLAVATRLNGKSLRRTLKALAAEKPENVVLILQGVLAPATPPNPGLVLKDAGFQVAVKPPKAAEPRPAGNTMTC